MPPLWPNRLMSWGPVLTLFSGIGSHTRTRNIKDLRQIRLHQLRVNAGVQLTVFQRSSERVRANAISIAIPKTQASHRRLRTVGYAELDEKVLEVKSHSVLRHPKLVCDLGICQAARYGL